MNQWIFYSWFILQGIYLEPKWPLFSWQKAFFLEGWIPKIEDKQVPGKWTIIDNTTNQLSIDFLKQYWPLAASEPIIFYLAGLGELRFW